MSCPAGLSVLMPVYNGMPYLPRAVASVLSQDHPNLELVITEDASRDDSREFLRNLRDSRVTRIENEKTQGLFENLNRMAARARHEDLKIFCQDDELTPGALWRQQKFLQNRPGLTATRCLSTTEKPWISDRGARRFEGGLPEIIYPGAADLVFLTFGNIMGNLSQTMVKRAALQQIGGFRQQFPFAGDVDGWVRLSRHGSLGLQNETLVMVRSHDQQGSKVLNLRGELYAQLDKIFDPLFLRLPPKERPLVRFHRSLVEGSVQSLQAWRSLFRGDFLAFQRASRTSPSRLSPLICASLGILSGFGRIGPQWTTPLLLKMIHARNEAEHGPRACNSPVLKSLIE